MFFTFVVHGYYQKLSLHMLLVHLSRWLNTMLIIDKHCSDIGYDTKIPLLFAMSMGKDIPFLSTENIKICGRTIKLEANAICLHFLPYCLNICRKVQFLISQGIVATCLR